MTKKTSFTWDEIFQTRARDPSVGRIAHPLSSLTKFFTRPIQNLPRFGNVAVIFYFQPSMVKGGMGHGFDLQMTIKAMLQCFTWERWHFSSVQFPSHPQRQETPGSNPREDFAQSKDDTIWSKSTWCWFRGCRMVTMRWARRQVSKEKREKRWSQTEIEKWARSQGCCSAGNLDDCWLKLLTFEKYILRNWEKLAHVWPQIWFDEWDISVVILTLQVSQVTVLSGLHGAGRGRGSSRREQASQGEGRSGNCLDFYDFNIWSQTSVYCDDSISDT